jgi:hypothetical protein
VGYLMNKCMRKTNHKTNLNEVAGALPAAWRSVVIGQAGGANIKSAAYGLRDVPQ